MHILHFSQVFQCLYDFLEVELRLVPLKSELILKQSGEISSRKVLHGDVKEVLIFEGIGSMNDEIAVYRVQNFLLYAQQVHLILLDNLIHVHYFNCEEIFARFLLSQHHVAIRSFAETL